MPSTVSRILNALDEPSTGASYISELLGLDQALAANVLQAANSAYLGYGPSCSNLSDAVMRLGFKRIRTLVLGVAASSTLNRSLPGYRLGPGELWNHSVATGTAAQWFARAINFPAPENAYVAGLLHDIGKLIMDQFAVADYDRLFDYVQNYDAAFFQVEQKLFGIDHAAVGAGMATKWNFPTELIEAIQFHHAPSQAPTHKDLAALINIANALSPLDQATLNRLGKRFVHADALKILSIKPETLEQMQERMLQYLKGAM
jgi:putative nucleotidyltransferase with HDIG domain